MYITLYIYIYKYEWCTLLVPMCIIIIGNSVIYNDLNNIHIIIIYIIT